MSRKAFKNNDSLPSADSTYEYTPAEVQEFLKCSSDPAYFIKTHMKIIHVDRGLVPFDLYDFQEDMVNSYHKNRFNITMCSRQVGKSTTVIGYFLHYILFNTNVSACISANKQKIAADLLSRLKLAYENLPRFLQQGVVRWAALEIILANGSRVFAAATSSSAVRGGSYNVLLLDEFAFVAENIANEFYASTFPTISSGKTTKIIMVSTPNGFNLFHKFWTDAQMGLNDFKAIRVNWDQVPGRDLAWKTETIRNCGGPEKFAQEFENSFLSTSFTLIRPATLAALTHKKPLIEEVNGYRQFEEPDQESVYMMTVDAATGQGLDYSAFVIVDVTRMPYRVAATYANNHVTSMEFPQIIMHYARRYFNPWILVEVVDVGRDVAHILSREFEYDRMVATASELRLGQRMVFNATANRHLGLRMTFGVKRSGAGLLKTLVEKNQLVLNDYRINQQLSVFVTKGATFEAQEGHHDDLVMALVVFGWATLQPNFSEISETRAMDEFTDLLEPEPITEGTTGHTAYVRESEPTLPMGITDNDPTEQAENRWLYG